MKPLSLVIALSCLAAGLVAGIAHVRRAPASPAIPSAPATQVKADSAVAPAAAPQPAQAPAPAPAHELSWRQIESEDYRQYIANLRAVGCPDQTIRDIVLADVNKLYAAREEPLKNKPKGAPGAGPAETPEQRLERLRQLRIVQQEKRDTIKELLGIEIPLDMLPSSASRDYHAFEVALRRVPAEKRDAVQALQETYWQQVDALREKYGKGKSAELAAESRQLADNLRQELAKTLTPQELEDYDLRTSPAAKQLSDKLGAYFRPSEEEFRQIFRAKHEYDQAIQQLNTPPAPPEPGQAVKRDPKAIAEARTAAQEQMNQQLKATLGEDRFNEYQRSQDRTYDLLARLGMRYSLPQETVLEAYEAQKSFAPPPGQKVNQSDLQKQLDERLTAILGEQAARGYRRVNGGNIPVK